MQYALFAATAACALASASASLAQSVPAPGSPQQDEAPAMTQEPRLPENPAPDDTKDYQAPAEAGPETPRTPADVPPTPPGAAETPSRAPADPSAIEPSAGAMEALPQGYQTVEAYLEEEGNKRRDLVGRPVTTLAGEKVGVLSEFVVRDSRHYAHLSLDRSGDNPAREVVVSLDKLHASKGGQAVIVNARGRSELEDLPRYDNANFQTVR